MEPYIWLICSLGAVLCWGLWAFLPKLALKGATPSAVFVVEALGAVAFGALAFFLADRVFHPLGALFAFSAGIVGYLGVFLFIRLAKDRHIGPAAAATSLYPVVTVILSAVFLKERLSLTQLAGVGLALVAVVLISLPAKSKSPTA